MASGCSRAPDLVRVGSKTSAEQTILGEIISQHLENRLKMPTERTFNLGGTLAAHQSLLAGEIDLYPEYSGAALTNILKLPSSPEEDVVFERVRREYELQFHLVWLPPLGFDNSRVMVLRRPDAQSRALETLSEAERDNGGFVLGATYEFMSRPDGFGALMRTYKLPLKGAPRTMDPSLLYQALEQKTVDLIAANTTDALLPAAAAKVVRDDRGAFPPYQAAIVVRPEALENHAGLREALAELHGKISSSAMQRLNQEVEVRHRLPRDVAGEFLVQAGLR